MRSKDYATEKEKEFNTIIFDESFFSVSWGEKRMAETVSLMKTVHDRAIQEVLDKLDSNIDHDQEEIIKSLIINN